MLRDHVAISQEVVSYDCPKCLSGGVCFVGMFVNGFRPMSRREQRLARKAAKNLVMYKTFGRRPWTDNNGVLYSSKAGVERMAQNGDDALSIAASYRSGPKLYRDDRRLHLREPCGFKAMSRLATFLRYGVDFSKREHPEFVGQGRRDD